MSASLDLPIAGHVVEEAALGGGGGGEEGDFCALVSGEVEGEDFLPLQIAHQAAGL